jgi:hypothetical protein
MSRVTAREVALLATVSVAPIALGLAMHAEHEARPVGTPAVVVVEVPAASPVRPEPARPAPPVTETVDVPAPAPPAALAFTYGASFAFVITGDAPMVVLSAEPDDAWVTTTPVATHDEWGEVHARAEVDMAALPAEVSAAIATTFTLYAGLEARCNATLGAPFMFADVSGDEGWDGDDDDETDAETRRSDPARARWAWADGRKVLVAPVVSDGNCDGATWARRADLPDARVYTPVAHPTKDNVQLARRSYLQLPSTKEARLEFERYMQEDVGEDGPPPRTKLRHRMTSTAWTDGDGDLAIVSHRIDGAEFGGCGGLEPRWGLSLVSDGGLTVDRVLEGDTEQLSVVLDLDNDGTPEIFTEPYENWTGWSVATVADDGWQSLAKVDSQPYFGCPC